jgi:hypothetical protein
MIHGTTPEEALKDIEEVKLDWIQSNLEEGRPIPVPVNHQYSGEIRVRMAPTLHHFIANRAMIEGVSLNQFMVMALARAVGYPEPKPKNIDKASNGDIHYEPKHSKPLLVTEPKRKDNRK